MTKIIPFEDHVMRPLQPGDTGGLLQLIDANRTRISNYLPKTAKAISDKSSAKSYIKTKKAEAAAMKGFCFVITSNDGKLCGMLFLKNFEWSVPKCELGYFIDKESEGKGIMTKALKALIPYCFDVLGLNKVFLRAAVDNAGSRIVAEKAGFEEEGIIRSDFMTEKGVLVDVVYYGLVKEGRAE